MEAVSGSEDVAVESRLNEGTAIEGAAGVACGVFWSSLSSSVGCAILTSVSFCIGSFSSLFPWSSFVLGSFSSSPCNVWLTFFESGGGKSIHDMRHVFGGCRCIKNVKDRINNEIPQTAIPSLFDCC